MIRYRADWVLPIASPPIRDGWVEVSQGRIVAVGSDGALEHDAVNRDTVDRDVVELGAHAILPGLVNAHTHLELSHLRGQIEPAARFVDWIRRVVAERRPPSDAVAAAKVIAGIDAGIEASLRCGTAVVGDISNSLLSVPALRESDLTAVVFYELIRFNAPAPESLVADARERVKEHDGTHDVRICLAAHAPYSVAPAVFQAIRQAVTDGMAGPVSVHLAESAAESEFVHAGTGDWRQFLEDIGAWNPAWSPSGVSPVAYLDRLGFLGPDTLAVHGVQMNEHDLAILAARGSTLVASPRSNQRTGAGIPPVASFFSSGVRIAVGTDSLASTPDLNLFAEIAELRRLAPAVPAARLLESATLCGAQALGVADDFGSIEPGKRARLLAVGIPRAVGDVEEYLVGGIEPDRIRWLEA